MHFVERLRACSGTPEDVFRLVLPGSSSAIAEMRERAAEVSRDMAATGVLLLGPPGSGKSTLARAISLCRYLHLLTTERAQQVLKTIKADGPGRISARSLDWYEEISLTGLVESLADAQLFGIGKGVASNVAARAGIFEVAALGHIDSGGTEGSRATGGVVFLDEIGDLSAALQGKLLTVLTGAEVARVGEEWKDGFAFHGLAIAATWKPLTSIREDLLWRLSDFHLVLPSLTERLEDFPDIVNGICSDLDAARENWAATLIEVKGIDKVRLEQLKRPVRKPTPSELGALKEVDWSRHGELRGLTQVLRRLLTSDRRLEEVLVTATARVRDKSLPELLFAELMAAGSPAGAKTVGGLVRSNEPMLRQKLEAYLREHPDRLASLCERFGIDQKVAAKRLGEMKRTRRKR